MALTAKVAVCAVLAVMAATGCDRSTSVGAAGGRRDADASDTASAADAAATTAAAADLCASSGGTVGTYACCANIVAFPDACAVGACGCAPAASHTIPICNCPGGCFSSGVGCVGAEGACIEGMDLSCNQDTTVTSPRGRCVTGSRCVCSPGAALSATTGKCL